MCLCVSVQDFFLPVVKLPPQECAEDPFLRAERPLLGGKGGKAREGAAPGWRSKFIARSSIDTFTLREASAWSIDAISVLPVTQEEGW